MLLVVNAGSDELSLFAVQPDGLRLADRVGLGGSKPTSVAVSGALVYVLNNGAPNVSGFNLTDGKLAALAGSTRPLSSGNADPAQISITSDGPVPHAAAAKRAPDPQQITAIAAEYGIDILGPPGIPS